MDVNTHPLGRCWVLVAGGSRSPWAAEWAHMDSKTIRRRKLRQDIIQVIAKHVQLYPDTGGYLDQSAFRVFRDALSLTCGSRAEAGCYDHQMYESAIIAYCAIVGL